MKKVGVRLALAGVILGLSVTSQVQADPAVELVNICTIIKKDDKSELRKKLKRIKNEYKLRLGDYYSGIRCGGDSMIRFAMSNDAAMTGGYLISQMRKSELRTAEQDGKTVMQWAEETGYIESSVGEALLSRISKRATL